jgi:putative phosphonate catabolism associated alcohol dehydrogenase
MGTARAAFFDGRAGQLELRDVPLPTPAAGETLVRVVGCTLCGSDVHSFDGRRQVAVPTVLGHEIVGEVVAVGDGVTVAPGARVVWAIVAHCGGCMPCRSGMPQKCEHAWKYGHQRADAGRELSGGLATHCLLARGTTIVELPETMPLEVAAPAGCATATVVAAFDAAQGVDGRSVLVFGAGMLGLTACAFAKQHGAGRVVAVDPDPERRALAQRFGADEALAPARVFAPERDGGRFDRGFDRVFEFSGHRDACAAAVDAGGLGADVVLVGAVFPDAPIEVSAERVVRGLLHLHGVHNYAPVHLSRAVAFLAQAHRRYPFAELVAGWVGLDEVDQAFARASAGTAVRVGVRP